MFQIWMFNGLLTKMPRYNVVSYTRGKATYHSNQDDSVH